LSLENYPIKYIKSVLLENGSQVVLRPMHPSDAGKAAAFRRSLTDDTIMARFLGFIPKATDRLISQLVFIDFQNEMAIVAEITSGTTKIVIGVGRISKDLLKESTVELAIIVVDKWQGNKLGTQLIDYMVYIAEDMGYKYITAVTSSYNERILKIIDGKAITKKFIEGGNISIKLNLT
jgi:acetyltransferase